MVIVLPRVWYLPQRSGRSMGADYPYTGYLAELLCIPEIPAVF